MQPHLLLGCTKAFIVVDELGEGGIYCRNSYGCKFTCGSSCTRVGGWWCYSSADCRTEKTSTAGLRGSDKVFEEQAFKRPMAACHPLDITLEDLMASAMAWNSTSHSAIPLLLNTTLLPLTAKHPENTWSGPTSLEEPHFCSQDLFFPHLDSCRVCER